jgi:hypothetical protein
VTRPFAGSCGTFNVPQLPEHRTRLIALLADDLTPKRESGVASGPDAAEGQEELSSPTSHRRGVPRMNASWTR